MEKRRKNELMVLKCIAELDGKQRIDSESLFEYLKEKGMKISRRSFANYINIWKKRDLLKLNKSLREGEKSNDKVGD